MGENRYGILVNDDEWQLLYKSVKHHSNNVESVTGKKPEDLIKLADDLQCIKKLGYIKTNNGNTVSEEEIKDRLLCDTCG